MSPVQPLAGAHGLVVAAAAPGALLLSAALTGLVLIHARRSGMLDLPGRRRSHSQPTPRGGGLGIAVSAAVGLLMVWPLPAPRLLAVAAGLLLVTALGWRDDRRGLPVLPRLAVQTLAAGLAAFGLLGAWQLLPLTLLTLGVIAFTNVMNFMDGSDGMATLEGLFLATALMLAAGLAGHLDWALWGMVLACACLGFLPFNLPRARIFLGDVGSTTLGFALALLATALALLEVLSAWQLALLASAFLADAGFTLCWRIVRGRRWYTAHREHTYQWLIRSGFTHGRVATVYMAWNLLLVSPLLLLGLVRPPWQPALTLLAYGTALAAWGGARAWCLARARRRY